MALGLTLAGAAPSCTASAPTLFFAFRKSQVILAIRRSPTCPIPSITSVAAAAPSAQPTDRTVSVADSDDDDFWPPVAVKFRAVDVAGAAASHPLIVAQSFKSFVLSANQPSSEPPVMYAGMG